MLRQATHIEPHVKAESPSSSGSCLQGYTTSMGSSSDSRTQSSYPSESFLTGLCKGPASHGDGGGKALVLFLTVQQVCAIYKKEMSP